MPGEPTEQQVQQICDLVFQRQKIGAIKLYREATGTGLKEAKDFVEGLTARLEKESPEKFTGPAPTGCGSAVLVLLCVVVWAIGFAFPVAALMK